MGVLGTCPALGMWPVCSCAAQACGGRHEKQRGLAGTLVGPYILIGGPMRGASRLGIEGVT